MVRFTPQSLYALSFKVERLPSYSPKQKSALLTATTPYQSEYIAWLSWLKRPRELESKRSQVLRRIFNRQDEIDGQRSRLIDDLEGELDLRSQEISAFTIQWELH